MPEAKSEMTIRTELLQEALEDRIEAMVEAMGVPFGYEEIEPATWRRRWGAMPPDQRLVEIRRLGAPKVLGLLRKVGANA